MWSIWQQVYLCMTSCVQYLHISRASCYTLGYQQPELSTASFDVIPSFRFLWCISPPSFWSCVRSELHHPDFTIFSTYFTSETQLLPPFPLFLFIWLTPLFLCLSLQGNTIESEHLSELTEEEYEAQIFQRQDLKGFMWLDAKYLNPFFTRRLTQEVRWWSERDRAAAHDVTNQPCSFALFPCAKCTLNI